MNSYSPQEYFYKLENMLLISCKVLRKLFRLRWKLTTWKSWEQTEQQGKEFIAGVGKTIYKDAPKLQKPLIAKGLLSEWDLPTLSNAIQIFGNAEDDNDKAENDAVITLKRLSNELNRHPSKKFYKKEYNRKVDSFRASLRALHVKDEEIDKMMEKAGVTSSKIALESFKKLISEGDQELKSHQFAKGLEFFRKVTAIPSLLPFQQGIAYEKCTECYLNLLAPKQKQYVNQSEAEKYKTEAFFFAKQALECNEESWKAHYLLAQLYAAYKKLDEDQNKPIHHCEAALRLAPKEKQLKTYLDYLKTINVWLETADLKDGSCTVRLPFLPDIFTESVIQMKAEKGITINLTKEQMRVVQKEQVFKGQEDVMQGDEYAKGLTVPQNYKKAVQFYKKAAAVNNAAGIYNLGFCYTYCLGVKSSLEAHDLFLKAANFPSSIPVPASNFCVENYGVADSQFALGKFYQNGINVEQDYSEATMWYKKPVESGSGKAAYALGLMYTFGVGVPTNYKTGENYLKIALNFGEYIAAIKLLQLYNSSYEPEKAKSMLEIIRKQDFFNVTKTEEIKLIKLYRRGTSQRKKFEQNFNDSEAENNLGVDSNGFSMKIQHYLVAGNTVEGIFKFLEEVQSIGPTFNLWLEGSFKWDKLEYDKFVRLLPEGSSSAYSVMGALQLNCKLWKIILETEEFRTDLINKFIKFLYNTLVYHFFFGTPLYLPPDGDIKLKRITSQLFEKKCVKNAYKSEDDKNIRFCYAYIHILCYQERHGESKKEKSVMIDILKEGVKMYPSDSHFYNLITRLLMRDEEYEVGLQYAEKGLEKFQKDYKLQFAKAKHFSMLPNSNWVESVNNYKKCVRNAPADYWMVPEAYYSIANIYRGRCEFDENFKGSWMLMKQYYKMGQWSEGNMISCHLPCGSKNKVSVKTFIEKMKAP